MSLPLDITLVEYIEINEIDNAIYMITKSKTEPGRRYSVIVNEKKNIAICSCPAYLYNKDCWHIRVAKQLLKDYTRLISILQKTNVKLIVFRKGERMELDFGTKDFRIVKYEDKKGGGGGNRG